MIEIIPTSSADLFGYDPAINLLPSDGIAHYYGQILTHEKATYYYDALLHQIAWQHDEAVIFGRHIVTARKVAWVGNTDYAYTYSGTTKQAIAWSQDLLALKHKVEALCNTIFNSCLLNLYHHGNEGMGWHSDDEKSLGRNTTIASLSLGAERKFSFRHKQTKQVISLTLAHGSLLIMKGETQTYWQHSVPKSTRIQTPRINLTFRTITTS